MYRLYPKNMRLRYFVFGAATMLVGIVGLSIGCYAYCRPKPPVYRADDVIGTWRHTFYEISPHSHPHPMTADVTMTFDRNGKFHERAISDLQATPIDAEGSWMLEPQLGRVWLTGALEYNTDGTWSRGDPCFDLKKVGQDFGGWQDRNHETWMEGGIIGDPDCDEYWQREGWSRKRAPLGAATQPAPPESRPKEAMK